ncbi:hypothetical protein EH165_02465 [Nakamurella antarctica]|uniref:Uncharacterized protein n=1 Tax=Nakamurella antarctica TaxID=1902245 RepID=A0A3G8ZJ12_9ACTN|nr:hypothetical protein [Nakamurella antarctica]AZI57188.1 hypothetical protein EH165_02465 [Nakamurella antarctica]
MAINVFSAGEVNATMRRDENGVCHFAVTGLDKFTDTEIFDVLPSIFETMQHRLRIFGGSREPESEADPATEYTDLPTGWIPIMEDLVETLCLFSPEIPVPAVKEKSGELRVTRPVFEPDPREPDEQIFDAIVEMAGLAANRTCQICGLPGKMTRVSGGIVWKVACPAHEGNESGRGYPSQSDVV